MRIAALVLATAAATALGGAVRADDVVYFTNGTAMSVRSHQIDKGMIRVDLGNNAVMAFPITQVEKVESGGRSIFPNADPANQVVATSSSGSAVAYDPNTFQTGHANTPSQFRRVAGERRGEMDPEDRLRRMQQERDGAQPSVVHPGVDTAAKRRLRIAAPGQPVLGEDGTYKRGNVSVIGAPGAPGSTSNPTPQVHSLGPRSGVPVDPPAEEVPDGETSGAEPDADAPPER